ncbi:MAG: hypothetical protein AAB384_03670 [Patescibacteria group bacterium]
MLEEGGEKGPREPQWIAPSGEFEQGEFFRTAEELHVNAGELLVACEQGALEPLSDSDWEVMMNTDSRDTTWQLQEVITHIGSKRDVDKIIEGFQTGAGIPAPVVLFREGEPPYLIGGNTRLLVARAMGIRPKIWAVHLK